MRPVSGGITNPLAPSRSTISQPVGTPPGQIDGAGKGGQAAKTPAAATAARLPSPEQTKATTMQTQGSPDIGIFGRIKAGLSAFKEAVSNLFTRSPATTAGTAVPAKPATVDETTSTATVTTTTGTTSTATVTTATGTTTTATVTTTTGTDAQPSTGATVRSLMDKLQGLMSYAGEKSVTSVSADELKSVLADTNLDAKKLKALDNIARQTADAFVRLDRLDPADIGAAYRKGLSAAGLDKIQEDMKTDPAMKSVYQAALILKDAINTQANLSESLRIVLRGVELSDDQYGAIMDMRLMCDRRIAEINTLGLELSTMDAQGARIAAGRRTTTQMLGEKTVEMHGNVDVFEALKGTPEEPSAADRLAGMLESFKDRKTVLTKQEFTELSRTVQELNFDLLRFEHSGAVAPNGVKMDKAVLAAARGVLGELLSKLEPPLMRGKSDIIAVAAVKDFARRIYSLGDSPLLSDKAIAVYRDAGLNNLVATMERYKQAREAAEAVIADSLDHKALETLLKCTQELHDYTGENGYLYSGTSDDFGTIARRGVAILDAASQESKDAFSPAELEAFTRALAGKKGVFNSALEKMKMLGAHEPVPLVEHIADISQKAGRLANGKTMTGEAVHAIVSGRTSFGTTVELLAHGLGPNDAPPPGIDDAHLVSSTPLDKGGVNSVDRVVYKGADDVERVFVFKPETSARDGFVKAGAAEGLYAASQQAVMLNLATQDVADAIGAGDVTVRSFCGMCKGEYGTFMDEAKGNSPGKFQEDNVKPDGFSKASLQSLVGKVRAGDSEAIAKSRTLISTFAQKANRLAWLDIITGQIDRHSGNYYISVDKQTGAVDLKAIDNDLAFSGHCFGLNKFHSTPKHARTFEGWLDSIHTRFYPGLSKAQFEAAYGIDTEHGVTRNPDGTMTFDLSKFASPLLFAGIDRIEWNCVPVPDEIDEDMYNSLMALDKQADGTPSQSRIEFEKQLRPRLDKAAFDAAMARLDEAIAAAKDIAAAGRVRKPEYWTSDAAIERAAHGPNLTRESLLPIIDGSAPLGLGTMPDGSKAKAFPPLPDGTTPTNIYQEDPGKLKEARKVVISANKWTDYMHRDMPEISELAGVLLQKREGEE